jgi:hypothetical protein
VTKISREEENRHLGLCKKRPETFEGRTQGFRHHGKLVSTVGNRRQEQRERERSWVIGNKHGVRTYAERRTTQVSKDDGKYSCEPSLTLHRIFFALLMDCTAIHELYSPAATVKGY